MDGLFYGSITESLKTFQRILQERMNFQLFFKEEEEMNDR
jgi:hypothetical protein